MSPLAAIRIIKLELTQREMARLLGIDQSTIGKWETGDRQPSLSDLRKIRQLAIARGVKWQDRWLFEAAA